MIKGLYQRKEKKKPFQRCAAFSQQCALSSKSSCTSMPAQGRFPCVKSSARQCRARSGVVTNIVLRVSSVYIKSTTLIFSVQAVLDLRMSSSPTGRSLYVFVRCVKKNFESYISIYECNSSE